MSETASQRAMTDVERVAQAMFRADEMNDGEPWGKWAVHYRAMAVAAITSLDLTEEWRTTGWLGPVSESLARKQAEDKGGTLQRRLVGKWQPSANPAS
jgi:hypothetical protein